MASSTLLGRLTRLVEAEGRRNQRCATGKNRKTSLEEQAKAKAVVQAKAKKPFTSEPKVSHPSYSEDADDEVPAEVCGQCNGHKKPPRDKKLA
jgi:hypothetical protein